MKTFKQHLLATEAIDNVTWREKSLNFILKEQMGFNIPLVASFLKKHFNVNPKTIAYHVSSYENLTQLISIQNTQKSISVTTKTDYKDFDMSIFGFGVQAGSGIVSKLEGTMVGHWQDDVMSAPDEQGRRWVNTMSMTGAINYSYPNKKLVKFVENDLNKIIETKLCIVFTIMFQNFKKTHPEHLADIIDETFKSWSMKKFITMAQFREIFNIIYRKSLKDKSTQADFEKLKSMIISTYIGVLQSIMVKYKKEFQEILFETIKAKMGSGYDEGIMSNFKIKEILVITPISGKKTASPTKYESEIVIIQKIMHNAYPKSRIEYFDYEISKDKKGNEIFRMVFTYEDMNNPNIRIKEDAKFKKIIDYIEDHSVAKFNPEYMAKKNSTRDGFGFDVVITNNSIRETIKKDGIDKKIPKITYVETIENIMSNAFFKG